MVDDAGGFPHPDRSSESRQIEANNIEIEFKDLAEWGGALELPAAANLSTQFKQIQFRFQLLKRRFSDRT
jgi:hypothetical protein